MKYLRGWDVKNVGDKTLIGLRLGIFKCFEKLCIEKGVDLKRIRVRVNYECIENQISLITCNKMLIKDRNLM